MTDVEYDIAVGNLKLLAGISTRPSERMHCLTELLRLRSEQLASEFRDPVPIPGPSIPPKGVTAALIREVAGPDSPDR